MNYQEAIKGYAGVIQAYAVAARTSESLSSDAWAVMAKEIDAALKSGKTVDTIRREMQVAEASWKESTGFTSMPSTYRSAKAVALRAAAEGVMLVGTDGVAMGKTAIESATKAVIAVKEAVLPVSATASSIEIREKLKATIHKAWTKLEKHDREEIVAHVNMLSIE